MLTHCTNLTYLTLPRWYKRNSIIFQLLNLSCILNSHKSLLIIREIYNKHYNV